MPREAAAAMPSAKKRLHDWDCEMLSGSPSLPVDDTTLFAAYFRLRFGRDADAMCLAAEQYVKRTWPFFSITRYERLRLIGNIRKRLASRRLVDILA